MLVLVTLAMPALGGGVSAQGSPDLESRWHLAVGVSSPRGLLPGSEAVSITRPTELTGGPAVWVDALLPPGRAGVRLYLQAVMAFTTVKWGRPGGNGVAGLAGSLIGGVQLGFAASRTVRPYLRLGFGSSIYALGVDSACLGLDPSCGLSYSYGRNHFDPAVQAAAGVDIVVLGRPFLLEANGVWSRFSFGDDQSSQRFVTLGIGLGL